MPGMACSCAQPREKSAEDKKHLRGCLLGEMSRSSGQQMSVSIFIFDLLFFILCLLFVVVVLVVVVVFLLLFRGCVLMAPQLLHSM